MNAQTPNEPLIPSLERVLATLAAAACLFITIAVWRSVSSYQPMWPLPGLYFVELPVVAVLTAAAFWAGVRSSARVAWIAAGIHGGFAFLALFSVGLVYAPIALMYLLLAVVATSRHHMPLLQGLGPGLLASAAQVAFMLFAVRVLIPG